MTSKNTEHRLSEWWFVKNNFTMFNQVTNSHCYTQRKAKIPYLFTDLPSPVSLVGPGCRCSTMMRSLSFQCQILPDPAQATWRPSPTCKQKKDINIQMREIRGIKGVQLEVNITSSLFLLEGLDPFKEGLHRFIRLCFLWNLELRLFNNLHRGQSSIIVSYLWVYRSLSRIC